MEVTSTTTKSYASDKVGAWNLKYEFESANGAKPNGVRVTGDNGAGGFINADISTANSNISFGGGVAYNLDVAASILTNVAEINASFDTIPA